MKVWFNRTRKYAKGFKQMLVWVPRDSESASEKLERDKFLGKLEFITAGWNKAKLSKFFSRVLKIVEREIKEDKEK